jgi:hypothetical protein
VAAGTATPQQQQQQVALLLVLLAGLPMPVRVVHR